LKRALPEVNLLRTLFDDQNPLSLKKSEAIQDETRIVDRQPKDRVWFEVTIAKAFTEGCCILWNDGIDRVIFAHKTTEGWKAILSELIATRACPNAYRPGDC
jgi:hypothetical protein